MASFLINEYAQKVQNVIYLIS